MTTAVVVGSGPNGLAAAVFLAREGVEVTVLEAADTIGGGTRTSELTPGLLHDLAVVNPPRAGMAPEVSAALAMLAIPRLVVVSCDPGSFGRDLGALRRAGYALRTATPVDQFPGTPHVETVAVLDRG